MDKDRLDQLLRELDKIHEEKIKLLYYTNILEEYKKCSERDFFVLNLFDSIKSDFAVIREVTKILSQMCAP